MSQTEWSISHLWGTEEVSFAEGEIKSGQFQNYWWLHLTFKEERNESPMNVQIPHSSGCHMDVYGHLSITQPKISSVWLFISRFSHSCFTFKYNQISGANVTEDLAAPYLTQLKVFHHFHWFDINYSAMAL